MGGVKKIRGIIKGRVGGREQGAWARAAGK